MSHRCRTRAAWRLLAVVIAIGVGWPSGPATAQDVPAAPTAEEPDEAAADAGQPAPPATETPPVSEPPPEPPASAPPEEPAPPADPPGPIAPPPPEPGVPLTPLAPAQPLPPSGTGLDAGALAEPPSPAPPTGPPPVAPSSMPWSFALTVGYYQPRLGTLNRILEDTSVTIVQDPNFLLPRNLDFSFEERNLAVEGIEGGVTYGVDTFYNTGGPHSFGISFSSWRGETIGQDTISLFLRSNDPDPIAAPRSARYNLILDQIFLEWRYHLFRDEKGKGVYLNAGLMGVTLAFFTMDALVNVIDPRDQRHFASVSSDESFGWGYTTRFGVGGDIPLTSWLSIGGRANYVLGNIRKLTVTRHFLSGFPNFPPENPLTVRPGVALPQLFFPPRDGRSVSYASVVTTGDLQEEVQNERDLTLELSGWEGLFDLTVHF